MANSEKYLEKMMESMIMGMMNNQRRESCTSMPCQNVPIRKGKKKRHRKHCKKKKSKCARDAADIICITKCLPKCKTPRKDPCCHKKECRKARIPICYSSESCASDPKYCSKCGQPLPGSALPKQTNFDVGSYQETHLKTNTTTNSPEETRCCCHNQTPKPCQYGSSEPARSSQNISQCVPDCNFVTAPCSWGSKSKSKYGDFVGNCDGSIIETGDIRIKTCGNNVVRVKCEEGDFNVSRRESYANVSNQKNQLHSQRSIRDDCGFVENEDTQCGQRFIQIAEVEQSNCMKKVCCGDYSAVLSRPYVTYPGIPECTDEGLIEKLSFGPCSDRDHSTVETNLCADHCLKPRIVRIKLVNPCSHAVKTDAPCAGLTKGYDSECVYQPTEWCTDNTSKPILPFCYDPVTGQFDDKYCDSPCNCINDPSGPSQPQEYRPSTVSDSPSRSPSVHDQPPDQPPDQPQDNPRGYDFFYGSVRFSRDSARKNASSK